MDEKKLSIIVLVFVFMVAIPSTIFLFSDTMSAGEVAWAVPHQQTNFANDPTPYRTGRGVTVQERIGEIYNTPEVPNRVAYNQTYSAMRIESCPYGCVRIGNIIHARNLEELGRDILYIENKQGQKVACDCPKDTLKPLR